MSYRPKFVPLSHATVLGRILIAIHAALVAGTFTLDAMGDDDTVPREASTGFSAEQIEFFEQKIRPILVEHCWKCHGPTMQKGGLRLDSRDAVLSGGDTGPAVVPGKPADGFLIGAVQYGDLYKMPPDGKLPAEKIEALRQWIELGAPWPDETTRAESSPEKTFDFVERSQHWCFQPLMHADPGAVSEVDWTRDRVDQFILAKLESAGLRHSAPADRPTLLRRLSFDLIGLPPTRAEIEEFLADNTSSAVERVVDRLLASPRFGERWARHWLDLVRYAETHGHEFDFRIPNAYQYRDYVIRAINADVPYDQFLSEHLAGDLLPSPRLDPRSGANESVLATGCWFLGEEVHSPVDIRADETDRTDNKIDVLSKAFLGLTVACARCHDHKFDAITTRDYYALAGFLVSGSYRQVPFESMQNHRRVAEELDALSKEFAPRIVRETGQALRPGVGQMAQYLLASAQVLRRGPLTTAATSEQEAAIPGAQGDVVFEDFEQEDYQGWTATGSAFGSGPVIAAQMPAYQGDVGARGARLLNSHHTRSGEDVAAGDAHVGTLTSEPFRIEHDYIHFLIGGGAHAGQTCLELWIGDKIAVSATGRNDNRLSPGMFDTRAYRNQVARLRVVDDHRQGWGNIGLDQIVFSNSSDSTVLETEAVARNAGWQARILDTAREFHLDAVRLAAWVDEVKTASDDSAHVLHAWWLVAQAGDQDDTARLAELLQPLRTRWAEAEAATDASQAEVVVVDYAQAQPTDWLQDGMSFGMRAVQRGEAILGDDPVSLLRGFSTQAAAVYNPVWDRLHLRAETETDAGSVNWRQSGRTLRTPSFTLTRAKLYYLVRGSGYAYAAVSSHRMLVGPLHGQLAREFQGDGQFQWVEHDLSGYLGKRLHVEFTPRDPDKNSSDAIHPLAIRAVVQADQPPPPPRDTARLLGQALAIDRPTPEAVAKAYQALFADLIERMTQNSLDQTPPPDAARLANWMLDRRPLFRPDLQDDTPDVCAADARDYLARRETIVSRIQVESACAPAMLEGSGVDEELLIRGNARTPGGKVPRRFLQVLGGDSDGSVGQGSGRLELAATLTGPASHLVRRVFVNRVWQHLFGRGIVPTVDNFGRMGQLPSHPELLDDLSEDFARNGWSLKALIRRLVLTNTYQMSSLGTQEADAADHANLLWHRMNVRRLEAEAIRDAVLQVSSTLDTKMLGPPVPIHLTEFLSGRGRPEPDGPLDGAGRRSVYLSVRRNFLDPLLLAFDFPQPSTTIGRRNVSNVPAQALALLNNPLVVQQAERWARHALADDAASDEERISGLYWVAYGRAPGSDELASAAAFVTRQSTRYSTSETWRAWSDLCHVLLNVKEFIFVR